MEASSKAMTGALATAAPIFERVNRRLARQLKPAPEPLHPPRHWCDL